MFGSVLGGAAVGRRSGGGWAAVGRSGGGRLFCSWEVLWFPWALWLPWAFYCVLLLRPICNKPQFPKRAVLRLHLHNNSASARGRRRRGLITLLPQRGKADNALVYLDSAEGQWEGPLAGVWGGWLTWAGLLMSPIHQKTLLHYLQERILRKRASWTMRGVSSVVHYLRRPTEVCVCHL